MYFYKIMDMYLSFDYQILLCVARLEWQRLYLYMYYMKI